MDSASPEPPRLVYFGTPEIAVPPLEALVQAGFDIPLVVSGADKRRGRGSALHPTPVKRAALEHGLTVTDRVDDAIDLVPAAEVGVVVAFGQLIRPHVLDALPMVNLHFSLLPRWRGAAPVERAILAGDQETGVCLMALEETLDTGPVFARQVVPIDDDATLDSLRSDLVEIGSRLLVETLADGMSGLGTPEPQVGEALYAKKITPEERRLDLSRSAIELGRIIRLGRAWCAFRGKRLRIWEATPVVERMDLAPGQPVREEDHVFVGTGNGALELSVVQPEGKSRMNAADWWNGAQPTAEDRVA